jgi:hypothetical protein
VFTIYKDFIRGVSLARLVLRPGEVGVGVFHLLAVACVGVRLIVEPCVVVLPDEALVSVLDPLAGLGIGVAVVAVEVGKVLVVVPRLVPILVELVLAIEVLIVVVVAFVKPDKEVPCVPVCARE